MTNASHRQLNNEQGEGAQGKRNHMIVAQLMDRTRPKTTQYFISATDTAFEVNKPQLADADNGLIKSILPYAGKLRAGFRSLQEMYWHSVCLPACDHTAWNGQIVTLPKDAWIIKGSEQPDPKIQVGEDENGLPKYGLDY